jgi:hypothetical protein
VKNRGKGKTLQSSFCGHPFLRLLSEIPRWQFFNRAKKNAANLPERTADMKAGRLSSAS